MKKKEIEEIQKEIEVLKEKLQKLQSENDTVSDEEISKIVDSL